MEDECLREEEEEIEVGATTQIDVGASTLPLEVYQSHCSATCHHAMFCCRRIRLLDLSFSLCGDDGCDGGGAPRLRQDQEGWWWGADVGWIKGGAEVGIFSANEMK